MVDPDRVGLDGALADAVAAVLGAVRRRCRAALRVGVGMRALARLLGAADGGAECQQSDQK